MKFITVDVTQEDIDIGQLPTEHFMVVDHFYARADQCPVAIAVRRQLPNATIGWDRWTPDGGSAIKLSKKAADYVHHADFLHSGHTPVPEPLKPIRLRLRIA